MSSEVLKEKHIDRLLAEELESSPSFALWFARKVFSDKIPRTQPSSCKTTIGYYRISGETDIRIELAWDSDFTAVIHVEDKVSALPQPSQADRYSLAVKQTKDSLAASALVAPISWMHRHVQETSLYNASISFEEIAVEFGIRAKQLSSDLNPISQELVKRLRWREQLFNGTIAKKALHSALNAGDLTDWNIAAAKIIEATNGLVLNVSERQRSTGRSKDARFIRFKTTFLKTYNEKSPILKLKTKEPKNPGRISLEIPDAIEDHSLRNNAESTNFIVTDTPKGTLIISDTTPLLKELTISKPIAEQVKRVEDGAKIAQKMIEWWEKQFIE